MEYIQNHNFRCLEEDIYVVFSDGQKHLFAVHGHYRSGPLLETQVQLNSQIRRFLRRGYKYEIHTATSGESVYSPLGSIREDHL